MLLTISPMTKPDNIEALLDHYFASGVDRREFSKEELRGILKETANSEREEMEKDEHRIYLENLLNYLPDKIYFKDTDSQILRVNQYFAKSHGYEDPKEMIGKSDFDLFPYKIAIQKYADEQKVIQRNEILSSKDELDEFEDGHSNWVSTTKLPLYSKEGKIIGSFGISRDITARKIAELKLQRLATELQEKSTQIGSDLEMARKVQMAFLPKNYPSFTWDLSSNESALIFFHRYIPSETLAGDFFQIIPISNSQAGVIICDVMGHGVRASLVTAVLRGLVGELKVITPYPHVFLRKVNQSLNSVLKQLDVMLFVTAFYGVFDMIRGEFRYANAGHPLPAIISRKQSTTTYLEPVAEDSEPALGLIDNFKYTSKTRAIQPGDSVVFYTDGILEIESEEGEQFGKERLLKSLSHPEMKSSDPILDSLFKNMDEFTNGAGSQDDMCAVSVDVIRIAEKNAG